MTQQQEEMPLSQILQTAERIFEANGFQMVSTDDLLFPSIVPLLAALKNGRLLVCVVKAFPTTEQFLDPDTLNQVRDELDQLVAANRPERDRRVSRVEKVAFVLVPGDITIASSQGDVKWVVVEGVEELPEEMDKVLGGGTTSPGNQYGLLMD